jgi:hypothetical protein
MTPRPTTKTSEIAHRFSVCTRNAAGKANSSPIHAPTR